MRDVTPKEGPNLAARLAAPKEGPAEGFNAVHASPLGDDDIPEFETPADDPDTGEVIDDSFPGDREPAGGSDAAGPAEANADDDTGSAAELLVWQRRLVEDMDGLSLEQLDFLLANPSDQEMFAELEASQPQLAMDLNKAITRRRKELA